MTGRDEDIDTTLLALFRAELEINTQIIERSCNPSGDDDAHVNDSRRAAHSIKGAASVVGLLEVAELCGAIETCLQGWEQLAPSGLAEARRALTATCAFLEQLRKPGLAPQVFVAEAREELALLCTSLNGLRIVSHSLPPDTGEHVLPRARSTPPRSRSIPPPPRTLAPAAPIDASLLALFAQEVEQCLSVLSSGIVALETESPSSERWEQLMRAAHSLKGAAHVVNLSSLALLSHKMEECFLEAQGARLVLGSREIDILLRALDVTQDLGKALSRSNPARLAELKDVAQLMADELSAIAQPDESLPRSGRRESIRLQVANDTTAIEPRPDTKGRAPVSLVPALVSATSDPIEASSRAAREPEAPAHAERVLRVAAESIERLLGLAGESLVESRRAAAFTPAVQHLKKQQTTLLDLLGSIDRVLGSPREGKEHELLVAAQSQARECARVLSEHSAQLERYARRAEDLGERLYREALKSRMRPFADGTHSLPRLVRDLARTLGKRARLTLVGETTEVDRDALESLEAPLKHLLRNALDHGIETPAERAGSHKLEVATLKVEARHQSGMLLVVVSDDGRGIDIETVRAKAIAKSLLTTASAAALTRAELLEFLFLPGFSTASSVSEISGRGVGLDVVRTAVEALGGSVRVVSELTRGTSFHLVLPVTRSVVRALVADIGGEPYAFPLLRIERIERVPLGQIRTLEGRPYILVNQVPVALVSARHLMGVPEAAATSGDLNVVVMSDRTQTFGVIVDEFRGEHDLVVRPLDPRLGKVQDIASASILADGSAALIVDVEDMMRSVERMIQTGSLVRAEPGDSKVAPARKRVLVVDDSITVREAERQVLVNRGYEVDVAVDGMDGLHAMRRTNYDLVITDVDMPRMNGIDLVRLLKSDPKLNAIPVVIVSYKDREGDRLRGLEAGANYYLSKSSFHDERLLEAVEDLIGGAAA